MANDNNTKDDIKYVQGGTGFITSWHEFQVNQGQKTDYMDLECRNHSIEAGIVVHGHVPYTAYYDAIMELVTQYPAPSVE